MPSNVSININPKDLNLKYNALNPIPYTLYPKP